MGGGGGREYCSVLNGGGRGYCSVLKGGGYCSVLKGGGILWVCLSFCACVQWCCSSDAAAHACDVVALGE